MYKLVCTGKKKAEFLLKWKRKNFAGSTKLRRGGQNDCYFSFCNICAFEGCLTFVWKISLSDISTWQFNVKNMKTW